VLSPEQVDALTHLTDNRVNVWQETDLPNGQRAKIKKSVRGGILYLKIYKGLSLVDRTTGTRTTSGEMLTLNTRTRTLRVEPGWWTAPVWDRA